MSVHSLPPLGALEAFVAVARRGSLKAAAPELNISVSALSRRIQTLESHLGFPVFERGRRDFQTTREGEALIESVQASFDLLRAAIGELRPNAGFQTLRIGAPPGLAGYWLAPRLAAFKALNPGVEIAIDADPNGAAPSRLGAGLNALIMVARDDAERHGDRFHWTRLSPMRVRAVCSPAYLAASGGRIAPADLAQHVVLTARDHPEWFSSWLVAMDGAPPPRRLDHFGSTPVLMEAAANGLGLVLATEMMAEAHVEAGRLVDPFDCLADTGLSYWLVERSGDVAAQAVRRLRAWLAESLRCVDLPARPPLERLRPESRSANLMPAE